MHLTVRTNSYHVFSIRTKRERLAKEKKKWTESEWIGQSSTFVALLISNTTKYLHFVQDRTHLIQSKPTKFKFVYIYRIYMSKISDFLDENERLQPKRKIRDPLYGTIKF